MNYTLVFETLRMPVDVRISLWFNKIFNREAYISYNFNGISPPHCTYYLCILVFNIILYKAVREK